MGLPPVVVGLFVTIFLWRNGPFGFLGILYTPLAMVIAQTIIAAPLVMGITVAAIQHLPRNLRYQILALGATRLQMMRLLVREARLPLLAAVMAGFGGVISEVGASIMVGGNIKGYTRVLTTATVMETSRGNFDIAIALGIILLVLSLSSMQCSPMCSSGSGRDEQHPGRCRSSASPGYSDTQRRGSGYRYSRACNRARQGYFAHRSQWRGKVNADAGAGISSEAAPGYHLFSWTAN